MSGYRRAGLGDAIPEIVSGHTADRMPTRQPHLAIVPLAFAGFRHADGRVLGFALVPPSGTELLDIPGLLDAFERLAPFDWGAEHRVVKLTGPPLLVPLCLAATGTTARRSLSPEPYLRPARVWASVTPVVLDRHLKRNGEGRDPRHHRGRVRARGSAAPRSGSDSDRQALRHRRRAVSATLGGRTSLDPLEGAQVVGHAITRPRGH